MMNYRLRSNVDSCGNGACIERGGAVLVGVLAAVAIVSAISFVSVRFALRGRQAVRFERSVLQSQFLCEAGLRRAEFQLKRDPNYAGEHWSPDVPHLREQNANVTIEVSQQTDAKGTESASRNVTVIAKLGELSDKQNSIQQSYTVVLTAIKN